MLEISGNLFGDSLFRDHHKEALHLLMTSIHRIFLVDFHQLILVIVDFLLESQVSSLQHRFF